VAKNERSSNSLKIFVKTLYKNIKTFQKFKIGSDSATRMKKQSKALIFRGKMGYFSKVRFFRFCHSHEKTIQIGPFLDCFFWVHFTSEDQMNPEKTIQKTPILDHLLVRVAENEFQKHLRETWEFPVNCLKNNPKRE